MNRENITSEKEKKVEDIKKEAEEKTCAVQKAFYYINEFIAGPMCGRCFPCALGTAEAGIRLQRLVHHAKDIDKKDIEILKRIGSQMIEGSFCKKGKETGKYLAEILSVSENEFKEHFSGICPEKECSNLIEYIIKPELCTMCGECLEACKYDAILGEMKAPYRSGYLPFEIRKKRCTNCGECVKVCPTGAIEIVRVSVEELADK
jgi:NADH-quinone oxidoreductase subunit F